MLIIVQYCYDFVSHQNQIQIYKITDFLSIQRKDVFMRHSFTFFLLEFEKCIILLLNITKKETCKICLCQPVAATPPSPSILNTLGFCLSAFSALCRSDMYSSTTRQLTIRTSTRTVIKLCTFCGKVHFQYINTVRELLCKYVFK